MSRRKKKIVKEVIITLLLAIFFFIFLSPIIIALSGSFRRLSDSSDYLRLFRYFSGESYARAFQKMNYFRSLKNSAIITAISAAVLLVISSMAGWGIARLKGKLGPFMQMFFLAGMIVSAQMSIIPMYKIVNTLKLSGTFAAPICMYITSALPFSIFLYTNFVKSSVPYALEEAARIDGASMPYIYFHIVLPMS